MRKSGALPLFLTMLLAVGALSYTLTKGDHSPQLGLDLQGGISVVLEPKGEASGDQLDEAIEVIRRRVDGLGVAEPEITRQGGFVVVSLPGVEDPERAIELVGRTARLTFRPVCQAKLPPFGNPEVYGQFLDPTASAQIAACITPLPDPSGATTTTTTPTSTTSPTVPGETTLPTTSTVPGETTPTSTPSTAPAGYRRSGRNVTQDPSTTTTTTAPPGDSTTTTAPGDTTTTTSTASTVPGETTTTPTTQPAGPPCGTAGEQAAETPNHLPIIAAIDRDRDGTVDECEVLGPSQLEGTAVSGAEATIPQGSWLVRVTLKQEGLASFNKVSAPCFNREPTCPGGAVAIVLDGKVESDPAPQTPTFDQTEIQITGQFDKKAASDLALVLRYGSLPIELEQQRVENVSATLGKDSLRAGLLAGFVGIAAVALYMLLYYRMLGIVVILGLIVWGALNYSIITWLSGSQGLALSLAGVTGIVVSVGVTTDSYIVYFERMKDELKAGKTVRSAVDHAFKRAWKTIVAADVAAFIGAALLFWLTVGAVRGFAFFLGLSTVLDLFTSYFFKRPMVRLLARSKRLTTMRWFGIESGLGMGGRGRGVAPSAAPAGGGR